MVIGVGTLEVVVVVLVVTVVRVNGMVVFRWVLQVLDRVDDQENLKMTTKNLKDVNGHFRMFVLYEIKYN